MVNLASALSEPLKQTPEAPLLKDLGIEFNSDGYFMFIAPAGLSEEARTVLSDAIAEIIADPSTKAGGFVNKAFGGAAVIKGAELDQFMTGQVKSAKALLKAASE